MQQNKTTLLFDLDGTLFDSIPVILETFQEAFQELKIAYPGDEIIKTFLGSDLENTFRGFLEPENIELGVNTYRKFYAPRQAKGIPLFPDVKKTLEYLKNADYQLGVVTTKLRKFASPLLETAHILDFFELVIGAEDVIERKPAAEPLVKATTILQTTLAKSVYIGDALIDLQASQNAGMDFVAITTGTTSAETFAENGQKIIFPNFQKLTEYF